MTGPIQMPTSTACSNNCANSLNCGSGRTTAGADNTNKPDGCKKNFLIEQNGKPFLRAVLLATRKFPADFFVSSKIMITFAAVFS